MFTRRLGRFLGKWLLPTVADRRPGRKCYTTSSLPSLFLASLTCSRLLTTLSFFMDMIKHISTFHEDNYIGLLQLQGICKVFHITNNQRYVALPTNGAEEHVLAVELKVVTNPGCLCWLSPRFVDAGCHPRVSVNYISLATINERRCMSD